MDLFDHWCFKIDNLQYETNNMCLYCHVLRLCIACTPLHHKDTECQYMISVYHYVMNDLIEDLYTLIKKKNRRQSFTITNNNDNEAARILLRIDLLR